MASSGNLRHILDDEEFEQLLLQLPEVLAQDDLFKISQLIRTREDYYREKFSEILDDKTIGKVQRFAALYCLLVGARHNRNFHEFKNLAYRYPIEFADQPAMLAMIAEADSYFATSRYEIRSFLDKCRIAMKSFDGVGLKLLAAEKILEMLPSEDEVRHKYLFEEAGTYIDSALSEYPRMPRYLSLKAQLLARQGHFPDARSLINDAMSLEDSSHSQYQIRIGRYEAIKSEITLLENGRAIKQRLDEAVAEFESMRSSLIEIVGLLAAVLALVITGTQIAVQVPAEKGIALLLVVGGILQLSYLGYSILLGRKLRTRQVLFVFIIGSLLVLSGAIYMNEKILSYLLN